MTRILQATQNAISEAASCLRAGGLVGMPTETVYGLAADARNGEAVARIFAAKGRPTFNPLIVHASSIEQAQTLGLFSEQARALAQAFWPGPLTLIVPRRAQAGLSELVSAGLSTVALRVPDHEIARALIRESGTALAAPSANRSGHLSPTTAAHVQASLGENVDLILAAGASTVGLESTVVDPDGTENRDGRPVILRPGGITAEDIRLRTGMEVSYYEACKASEPDAPPSPGMLLKHYAPGIPLRMNAIDLLPGEALLAFGSDRFMGVRGEKTAAKDLPAQARRNLSETGDLYEAAANLFAMLYALDTPGNKGIAVMAVPDEGIGRAINDRLRRAAAGTPSKENETLP